MTMTASAATEEVVHISKDAAMRILSDVREIMRNPLHGDGIYYLHDDEDILTGHAMLYGQPGTAYHGGYYFFKIKFPPDYPHKPPVVTFLSNDGNTRMHPNFYKNGYVCLSILGNWRGDQWSGCITLKSILLTMISIMDAKPMLHEPGVTPAHADFAGYHRIIEYKNVEFAVCKLLNEREFGRYIALPDACRRHYIPIMRDLFSKNRAALVAHVDEMTKRGHGSESDGATVSTGELATTSAVAIASVASIYGMNVGLNYAHLKQTLCGTLSE
jgi:ubiquitin-conjugating enzyme E2 Z